MENHTRNQSIWPNDVTFEFIEPKIRVSFTRMLGGWQVLWVGPTNELKSFFTRRAPSIAFANNLNKKFSKPANTIPDGEKSERA